MLTLLLAAGCGSDSATKQPPLSATQFRAKANTICTDAKKNAVPFPGKRSGKGLVTTANLIAPYLEKTLKVERASLVRLKSLAPPTAQKDDVAALVDAQA